MNPHHQGFNENQKRRFITAGIRNETVCNTTEVPIKTFLGTTDKKGYKAKTVCSYLDEYQISITYIEPWDLPHAEKIIKQVEENSKSKFADALYLKLYN